MPVDMDQVVKAAQDLLERYGDNALAVAQDRVAQISRAGDQSALDLALMVLTEVERHHSAGSR